MLFTRFKHLKEATPNTRLLGLILLVAFHQIPPLKAHTHPFPSDFGQLSDPIFLVTEAATIPLAALTASLALFRSLGLPQPWSPADSPAPLLIYGGSSAVGAFAIKLAAKSNLHPIIAVTGAGSSYVSTLLDPSKGDTVIDYRHGRAALESGIRSALANSGGWKQVSYAVDAIAENGSSAVYASLLGPGGRLAHVLPLEEGFQMPEGITATLTMTGDVHSTFGDKPGALDFEYVMMKAFPRGLEMGWFRGHPLRWCREGCEQCQLS